MEPIQTRVIFFDLDGTLFDHYHSLRLAISAIQKKYTDLAGKSIKELIDQYNAALQQAYDDYLDKVITYEEADTRKIYLFFASLGLPEPSLDDVREFRDVYKAVYRANRRATPGSIEALTRLREHGYRTAIITNGQIEDQAAKAETIGILHLVECIITSEEVGYRKPDPRIFQYAIEQLGASLHKTHMVGDSVDADIKGALDAQLHAILYSPMAQDSQRLLFGQQISVIRHMNQLLSHFGITATPFKEHFTSTPGKLVIEGIGLDLVTESRHCLQVSKEVVQFLVERMGIVLTCAAKKRHALAMSVMESMIREISKATGSIDEAMIQISFPGQGMDEIITDKSNYQVTNRDYSIRAEYMRLALDTDLVDEAVLREVATLLQGHCNDLMRDCPREAIRQLGSAMLILSEQAGIEQNTSITGEQIGQ